ncbi:tetratricopeptide repeat protein [Rhodopila sp.]|uniref:tetratricopeptide repeat protein n=1 Tax=Rhodopila sp. TaxID=2480087 RepID=UPI003D110883
MNLDASLVEHKRGFDLHLQGRPSEAEPFYRKAVQLDPELKEAWMNLGLVALSLGKAEEAQQCQREALRLDPDMADAHNNLGMVHYSLGRMAEAESCFRAALRLHPEHANATLNLGSVRQIGNDVEEAEGLFRCALALGVDPARANSNLSLALMEQVRPEEAETCCREALDMRPDYPEARANLALALLMMGRLEEGWQAYESRWHVEAMAAPPPTLPRPRWTGQALNGETVLLYAEQGFGDTLQFCRYASMVAAAGGRVVLVVPKPLGRLMTTLEGVAQVLSEDDAFVPPFDYHCPLLSLPFAFGTTMETIPAATPYLHADPSVWAEALGALPGLKVGLVWAGKSRIEQPHAVAIDRRRSMRLVDMAPLFAVAGVSFVSLQLGPPAGQMRRPPGEIVLHDFSDRLGDWADTADLIAGLDLVIAVDTAVVHLAGALGKPVWMLNRFDSCWRWFIGRDDTPWYPTMRLFRQTRRGDWAGVIERVRVALQDLVAAGRR